MSEQYKPIRADQLYIGTPGEIRVTKNEESQKIAVNVDTAQVDEAIEKVNQLHETIKKAKSLADELADKELSIKTSISD